MASSSSSSNPWSRKNKPQPEPELRTRKEVTFDAGESTLASFKKFGADCLAVLSNTKHLEMNFLPSDSKNLNNYIFLKLKNGDHEITLVIRRCDLYLVGFRGSGDQIWFFNDIPKALMKKIFSDPQEKLNYNEIPFIGSYIELSRYGSERSETNLGAESFKSTISTLFKLTKIDHKLNETLAKGSLVLVQMVSEALRLIRFNTFIENTFDSNEYGVYPKPYVPDYFDESCQNQWGSMSERGHNSVSVDDTFERVQLKYGVQLKNLTAEEVFERVNVDSVRKLQELLNIMNSK